MCHSEGGVALQWSPWVVGYVGGCCFIGVVSGLLVFRHGGEWLRQIWW